MINAEDIKRECRRALADMPTERENSLGIVSRELEQRHCDAAWWLYQKFGMELDVHNLHDVIDKYEFCQTLSKKVDTVVMSEDIESGRFNPVNLIEFFKTKIRKLK